MSRRMDAKARALREQGALNAHSRRVTDPLFRDNEFFDPRDLVQVRYEMLRRVSAEGHSVSQAARAFGFSRPTFYQAQSAFTRDGLPALVPRRPGPRSAHKLSEAVLQFIDQRRSEDAMLRSADLAHLVQERFGISVHPRSIERALRRRQKKGR